MSDRQLGRHYIPLIHNAEPVGWTPPLSRSYPLDSTGRQEEHYLVAFGDELTHQRKEVQ
jgi:hypothetical protein